MKKTSKLIIIGAIILFIIIAAIKNPSSTDAKQLIKDYTIDKINKNVISKIDEEDKADDAAMFGQMLGSILVSKLIDNFISYDVTDFVIFSTFSVTSNFENNSKDLVSGIILFGNVIPLSSDIKASDINEDNPKE